MAQTYGLQGKGKEGFSSDKLITVTTACQGKKYQDHPK